MDRFLSCEGMDKIRQDAREDLCGNSDLHVSPSSGDSYILQWQFLDFPLHLIARFRRSQSYTNGPTHRAGPAHDCDDVLNTRQVERRSRQKIHIWREQINTNSRSKCLSPTVLRLESLDRDVTWRRNGEPTIRDLDPVLGDTQTPHHMGEEAVAIGQSGDAGECEPCVLEQWSG